jgi:superfamily II DNA or RNA helicase
VQHAVTLHSIVRWADKAGLGRTIDAPIKQIWSDLAASVRDEAMLQHLVVEHEAKTLREALEHPAAETCLADGISSPSERAAFRTEILGWLAARTGAAPIATIPFPPADETALRSWATAHGVLDRLDDPAIVLSHRVRVDLRFLAQRPGGMPTVGELASIPERSSKRAHVGVGGNTILVEAARAYLHDVARAIKAAAAAKQALDARAKPPEEPPLRALLTRLEVARAEMSERVARRPIGLYSPRPVELREAPLRLTYQESAYFNYGPGIVRVDMPVEEDPLRPGCTCAEGVDACQHMLTALDNAVDVLRDPQHPLRRKLVQELATPGWERFLRAFGEGLGRAVGSEAEPDTRIAFKIEDRAGTPSVEVVVQKVLKRGGWSAGTRLPNSGLLEEAKRPRDPRDAPVLAALTDGFEETGGFGYHSPSRARMFRVLSALVDHPRAFVAGRPARVAHARLRLVLEPAGDGVEAALALGPRRFRAAEIRAAAQGGEHIIAIDGASATVTLGKLDERARALVAALERHPTRFPPESHDELLRHLQRLQESVEIELPEALQGAPVPADARPVVRLAPDEGGGETEVAVLMRPIAGGPVFPPGEGPAVVMHAVGGRRVAAHRALAEEPAAVRATIASLPLPEPMPGEAWRWKLAAGEAVLDLLAALRTLGDAVVVEWPEAGKKVDLASTSLRSLRLRITERRDWFGVEGGVEVDGEEVPFAALLDAVRSGRRYVQVSPNRFAAIEDDLRQRIAGAADALFRGRHGVEVSPFGAEALADLVDDPGHLEAAAGWHNLVRRIDAARSIEPAVPEGLTAELRHYQVDGFRWLARLAAWGMGGCLADDMGLGKTVQALALLVARASLGPALVVAPTSVGPNWVAEAARFAPGLRVRLYREAGREAMLADARPGDLFVTSYGLATRDADALRNVRFATLIIDEAQAIKNALTRRARAVRDLDAAYRVALTGTPVENHLGELWSLMRILAPGLLGSWDQFRERFVAPIERYRDPERRAALARLLRPFLLRRTKAEVAPELPERTEIARFVDLSAAERRLYDDARRAALVAIASGEGDARFVLLAALTKLRRLACHPRLYDEASTIPSSKLAALLEIVRELRETGHRALVFSQFTSHLALVREALDAEGITYAYLDGSTPSEERTRRIAAFQAGGSDLFLISLKAGGTGLNLTAADYVIHLDPWWNPAVEDQATDRAHRIGQTRAVTVIRLIVRGTIEEAVLALHGDKRALAAGVFDEEGGPARLSTEDLADLIRIGAAAAGSTDDDAGDALGAEVVTEEAAEPPSAPPPSAPPPPRAAAKKSAKKPAAAPRAEAASVATLAGRALDQLAARKGIADRRYDATLRTYERSLRRFTEYVTAQGQAAKFQTAPAEVIQGYLVALSAGRWPAPASEPTIARTALKHLRDFLAQEAPR